MTAYWTYEQASGKLIYPDGVTIARGYSGHGEGVNNPDMEAVHDVGPIPRGTWAIDLHPLDLSHGLGPLALPLVPVVFDPHGRSAFRIHGDTAAGNQSASHGCVIMPRATRQAIIDSGITTLQVVHR